MVSVLTTRTTRVLCVRLPMQYFASSYKSKPHRKRGIRRHACAFAGAPVACSYAGTRSIETRPKQRHISAPSTKVIQNHFASWIRGRQVVRARSAPSAGTGAADPTLDPQLPSPAALTVLTAVAKTGSKVGVHTLILPRTESNQLVMSCPAASRMGRDSAPNDKTSR